MLDQHMRIKSISSSFYYGVIFILLSLTPDLPVVSQYCIVYPVGIGPSQNRPDIRSLHPYQNWRDNTIIDYGLDIAYLMMLMICCF